MNSHNFYHYDGLGSVVALSKYDSTLGSAVIVERYQYSPFGITTIYNADKTQEFDESQYGNPYMFTGRRFDPETGLYYYRMRYYSPDLGRFLQPDPIGYADGMNIYAYVGNNPLNWIDPWGLAEVRTRPVNSRGARALAWYFYNSDSRGEHWQFFYDDGTNSGYFKHDKGTTPIFGADDSSLLSNYNAPRIKGLDDNRLRAAEKAVQERWKREGRQYGTHIMIAKVISLKPLRNII